ncbi:MAG TPA: spore cortex-lytic enzyme, partial [Clostridia bacterium]|nr:spore cortex-lytic enzyme [Clostridia bacterium]
MLKMKKTTIFIFITLLVFGFVTFMSIQSIEAASLQRILKVGTRGEDVAEVQKMLASLGVDVGPIDGIFGPKTKQAVIVFQKYNNLKVDGMVGQQTYSALLLHTGKSTSSNRTAASTTVSRGGSRISSQEMQLLAQLISSEAKGEPYEGQVAVGA